MPYNEQIFVVSKDDDTKTTQFIPRETLRRVATPQAYQFGILDAKYHEAFEKGIGIYGSHYTIVSNGAMCTKNYSNIPKYSILQGVPAKLKASGLRRIYNEEWDKKLNAFFMENPNQKKTSVPLDSIDSECDSICNDIIKVHIH